MAPRSLTRAGRSVSRCRRSSPPLRAMAGMGCKSIIRAWLLASLAATVEQPTPVHNTVSAIDRALRLPQLGGTPLLLYACVALLVGRN